MSALYLTVTDAGRAALTNAQNSGTAPVLVATIGVTATAFTASSTTTSIPGEIKRVATIAGGPVAPDTIHVTIRDDSTDTYSVLGLGVYLGDGTLFAVFSQATALVEKSSQATLLLACDWQFADITSASLTFGDTNFLLNQATTDASGLVELATSDETTAGVDAQRAVTPASLLAALNARLGAGAPSTFVKSLLTAATSVAFRAALAIKGAALYDTGAGNGLDADKLDGQEGAYYRDYGSLINVPLTFAPAQHTHPISEVVSLASTLDGKLNVGTGNTLTGVNKWLLNCVDSSKNIGLYTSQTGQLIIVGDDWNHTLEVSSFGVKADGNQVWHAGNLYQNDYSSADMNGAVLSGFYRLGATNPNLPTGIGYGQMIVCHGGGDTVLQIASDYQSTHLYFRGGNPSQVGGTGSYGPWRNIWHDGNLNPADINTTVGRILFRRENSTGYSTIDSVNTANSAYVGLNFTSSAFRFAGGNATFTGAVVASGGFQVSDRRSKYNIKPRSLDATLGARLAPLWSQWRRKTDRGFGSGLVAQDVLREAPRFVRVPKSKGEHMSVDIAGIAMECAIAAYPIINDLLARIEALESRP